jgi:hypothetical protein
MEESGSRVGSIQVNLAGQDPEPRFFIHDFDMKRSKFFHIEICRKNVPEGRKNWRSVPLPFLKFALLG